jgi:hypothetical protein
MRFTRLAIPVAAALAAIPAGAAVAQSRPALDGPARAASTSPAAALPGRQRISLTSLHLVTGVIRDQAGHPLAGICVLATGLDAVVRIARTSASGRFAMSVPRIGTYSVGYRYCQPAKAGVLASSSASARQIEVGAAPVTVLPAITLRLTPQTDNRAALAVTSVAVSRAGRITWLWAGAGPAARGPERGASGAPDAGGLTGRVTNAAGRPLAGICVSVVGNDWAEGAPTNANGRYDIGPDDFYPGRYLVLFTSNCLTTDPFVPTAPGPWAPEWYKGKFARAKASKVQFRVHKATRGVNAVMQHAAQISGVVTGSDGRRVKDACAVVWASPNLQVGLGITNSGGAYDVNGLDPGRYRVLVAPACIGASDYGQVWYPRAQTFGTARAIAARLAHRTRGIDVVVPKLGTVTGFIRLGSKTGKPLGGVCVSVLSSTNIEAGGFATSQKSGKYVVPGVPAGDYQVEANAGCGNNGNYAPAYYPRAVHVADARTTSGINLYLQPGGTLSGTVTDAATAKPLAGICVTDDDGDIGVTSSSGTYTIDQLPAERSSVDFFGGCGNKGSYAPQYYDDQVAQEAAQQVTVTAGHVTGGIDAAMLPGATIAGRVTNSAGRPVSGVCIGILPENQAGLGLLGGNALTSSSGAYIVANLAPGYYVAAFFSGCAGPSSAAVLQWFKAQSAESNAGLIDAAAGAEVSGIDAVVSPAGTISGTVTGATGQAIETDCVAAFNRRTGQPGGFQSLTGAGEYTVSGLAPGSYTIVATDCGYSSDLAQSVYERPVAVRAGRTTGKIALSLPIGAAVTGRVTTAGSGRPVPDACVDATPLSAAVANLGIGGLALTTRSGTYKIAGLRTGSYLIEVFPSCFGPAVNLQTITLPHPVRVTQGKVRAGVNATLPAGGSIAGRVTGPAAAAVPGACVETYQIPGGMAGGSSADADGRYVVTGLAPGRYKVEFGDPSCSDDAVGLGIRWYDGAAGSGSATVITVKAGQMASAINATLPADGAITGSVTGTSAALLNGVCVSAVPLATGEQPLFTVSGGGRYTLADLLAGQYRVEFQAGCGRAGLKTQWWRDAASAAAAEIITVTSGATVSGIDAVMTGG